MKKFFAVFMAVMMVVAMAACGGGASSTPASSEASGAAPAEATGGSIKVGILGPHSGDYAVYGQAVRNGAQLYIDQVNAAGGINGKQVETVVYDQKADSAEAVTAFTRMVDDGITALIGDVLTGNTLAVVPEANAVNMPMVTASATAAAVTYDEDTQTVYSNVFRTCFIDPFQGEKMAQYSAEVLGAKTAAILTETGNDYSNGLADTFSAKCAELGVEIVQTEAYATGDKDFKSQLTNINAKTPDVIFCPNYYQDDGLIVTQAREIGSAATFVGGDGWDGVKDFASAEDLEGATYCSGYAPASTDAVKAFEAAYTAAYGADTLNMFAATGYDAAAVVCNALKVVEGKGGMEPASEEYKQAVIDAIRDNSASITDAVTSNGYSFDEFNNPIKDAAIMKLVNGVPTFDRNY